MQLVPIEPVDHVLDECLRLLGGGKQLIWDDAASPARFQKARQTQTVAMLSENVEWHESTFDPSRLQLTEARQHASTDLARLCNVPAAIVHAPTNDSLTYSNEADQRADLWYFGLAPLAEAIQQTLSGPNVTPRGTVVRFDPTNATRDVMDPTPDNTNPTGSDNVPNA